MSPDLPPNNPKCSRIHSIQALDFTSSTDFNSSLRITWGLTLPLTPIPRKMQFFKIKPHLFAVCSVISSMARKLRHCPKGSVFHLCNRAVMKTQMFFTDQEYQEVELVFREALQKFPVSIFAYCIMPNHWHLLGRAEEEKAISRFMHWFGTTQSKRWRTANETIGLGSVFQNRFRSHAVVGQKSFLKVAHYIERNPVASNLCKHPKEWSWSSANPQARLPLSEWPTPKPADWPARLNRPTNKETLKQIRVAKLSSRPFADKMSPLPKKKL